MINWEYMELEGWLDTDERGYHGISIEDLNKHGQAGWKVVSIERKCGVTVYAFLKRRFEDPKGGGE